MNRRGATLAVLLSVSWSLGGCATDPTQGYSAASSYPQNISTVAIGIFENRTYDRDFEYELTDALIKELEARTPYKVTSPSRADTILTGRIQKVDRRQLSKSRLTGLSEEVTLSVTIDVEWKDLRSGESLLELKSFTTHSLFVPSNPTREPIEIGQFGVAQQVARDLIAEMRADW